MITACWSLKGGAGTTVVAAGMALVQQRRFGRSVLLVDLAGEQPSLLGLPEPAGPGVAEWLAAGPDAPPDALARLETEVGPGLALLHRGRGELAAGRGVLLLQMLALSGRTVLVDCGTLEWNGAPTLAEKVAADAARSLLVTRNCCLALRRAERAPISPTGVVVVREPGRALSDQAVAATARAPVVASIAVDPAVARAVDAGLLLARLPRGFAEVLRKVA